MKDIVSVALLLLAVVARSVSAQDGKWQKKLFHTSLMRIVHNLLIAWMTSFPESSTTSPTTTSTTTSTTTTPAYSMSGELDTCKRSHTECEDVIWFSSKILPRLPSTSSQKWQAMLRNQKGFQRFTLDHEVGQMWGKQFHSLCWASLSLCSPSNRWVGRECHFNLLGLLGQRYVWLGAHTHHWSLSLSGWPAMLRAFTKKKPLQTAT